MTDIDGGPDREWLTEFRNELADFARPMGEAYYTASPGSPEHRAAYADYAAVHGTGFGPEVSVAEAYGIDNACELAALEYDPVEEYETGDPNAPLPETPARPAPDRSSSWEAEF